MQWWLCKIFKNLNRSLKKLYYLVNKSWFLGGWKAHWYIKEFFSMQHLEREEHNKTRYGTTAEQIVNSRIVSVHSEECLHIVLSPSAHLQGEHKVAADALLSDDVLHGAKCGAQIGVEKLSGQQTHRGGHQVVWQRHVCDLKIEKQLTEWK